MADQNFDLNEMMRKAMLMRELQQQPQPDVDFSKVAGSSSYQPQTSQYTPQLITPPSTQLQVPPTTKFDTAAANLQNVGPPPVAGAKDPTTGKDLYPRNKPLAVLMGFLGAKQFIRNPKQEMENIDYISRKGYGAAERDYASRREQAETSFKIQSDVLNEQLKVFNDSLTANRNAADMQMSIGKYNQWVMQLPQEQQYEAARLGEMQARAVAARAPTYSKTPEMIRYYGSDGKPVSSEGFIKTFPDGRMPEYIVPGVKDPIKNEDVLGISKATTPSSNPVIQEINDRRQELLDKQGFITPAQDDEIIKTVRLLPQTEIAKREAIVKAKTTIGGHINKDYLTPLNKTTQSLNNVKLMVQAALGETDPTRKENAARNAVAAAVVPLEEVRNIVGSGRVAVSEYPIIKDAPGKPQSAVAWAKNWLGLSAPISDATLNDLQKLIDLQLKDAQGLKDIASDWNYKILDANTEEDATGAGKSFDAAVKAYQNPEPPKPTLEDELKKRGLIK